MNANNFSDNDYLRISEAARLLRVTPQTIRHYHQKGLITGIKTPGGQTIYTKDSINQILRKYNPIQDTNIATQNQRTAYYARASDGDTTKINNQIEQLTQKHGASAQTYKDKASGLNEKRPGLQRLIKDARAGKINHVYITQKDRITRFGYTYLEQLLNEYGCELTAEFDKQDKTLQDELMQDFMSLIASFSGKYYRIRGYEQKQKLLNDANTELQRRKSEKDNEQS